MKKIILTFAFLGIATSMFAYTDSDFEDFMTLINIVLVGMGVLQVILFFKIWGMTNDVRKLKETLCISGLNDDQLSKKVLKLKYTGKIDEAKKVIDENMENEVFNQLCMRGNDISYTQSQVELIIKKYEKYYKMLNCEMPAEIKNIKVGKVVGEFTSM